MAIGFVDFSETTPEGIEEQASKAVKQPGYYHVKIDDVDDTVQNGIKFVFELLDGPGGGKQIHTLFGFDNCETEEKRQKVEDKIRIWAKRLKVAPFGENREVNWVDAIGWEGFIKLKPQQTKVGVDAKGKDIWGDHPTYLEIGFADIWPLDYPPNKFPPDFQKNQRRVWGHLLTGKDDPTIAERAGRTSAKAAAKAEANGGGETGAPATQRKRATVDDL